MSSTAPVVINTARDTWQTLTVAGGIGVAGALLGAAVAGGFGLRTEDKRQKFLREQQAARDEVEAEQVAKRVVGVARVLTMELEDADFHLRFAAENKVRWPEGALRTPGVHVDDLKLLATNMDGTAWAVVADSLKIIDAGIVRRAQGPDLSPEKITDSLTTASRLVRSGIAQLAKYA